MASTSLESVDALSGMNGKVDCIAYLNLVSEPGAVATGSNNSTGATIRSHPPPHAGCPRGDPGPLAVLHSWHWDSLRPLNVESDPLLIHTFPSGSGWKLNNTERALISLECGDTSTPARLPR